MPDLNSIITDSIAQATPETDTTPETVETTETADPVDATAEPVATAADPVVDPLADLSDDLDKELEGLGLKAAKEGEKENRIPYSRVKKIVAKALKTREEAQKLTLAEHTTKLTKAEARAAQLDNLERMADSDPDKYVQLLAAANPAYKKYVQQVGVEAAAAALAPKADPMPPPDTKYADGSEGYSQQGLQALLSWHSKQVEQNTTTRIQSEYDKRFGPIEKDYQTQKMMQERIPVINAQISRAKTTWGEALFTANEPLILKALADNPNDSFAEVVATVLAPKMQANRDTMRADLLKEINTRPAAASTSVPAAAAVKPDSGPKSMEDVIRASMATIK